MGILLKMVARRWPMAMIRALDAVYGRSRAEARIMIAGRWARITVPGARQPVVLVLPDEVEELINDHDRAR